jgi:IclR family KDG regulon transcriptional repressor
MPRVNGGPDTESGILAVALTFRIVDALTEAGAQGVTELARSLGATKTRIYRHLDTLVRGGWVLQDPASEKYRIGPRMVSLAHRITDAVDMVAMARPSLVALRDGSGQTALLAKLEGETIRVLDVALGTSDFAIMQRPGNSLPPGTLHCSALGKIALAFGPDELRRAVLAKPLRRMTASTIVNGRALREELDRVRRQGWASVPDEGALGFNAIAAPIRDARASLAAMVGLIGATRSLPRKLPAELVSSVLGASNAISRSLGYPDNFGDRKPLPGAAASRIAERPELKR